jgi:predicted Zn-dependent protease
MLRAQVALNNGRDGEAVSILGIAARLAPRDPTPLVALARYQIGQKKFADAQKNLEEALRISPDDGDALALEGDILFATGATPQAMEKYRALRAKYPTSPDVQIAWAKILNRANDQVGSESAATKAVELAPGIPQYRSALIALQVAHGKSVDALLTAHAYSALHPGPIADLLVSGTLLLLNRNTEAEALLEKSFAKNPEPNLAFGLSQIEIKNGNGRRAAEVLALAVQKNPDDFMLRRQYAVVLMETGDKASARREFERLVKERPEDTIVLTRLVRLIQKEDPDRAMSLVSLAARIAPVSAEIVDSAGWMKFERRDVAGALPLLQRAHRLQASNPEIAYHYAVALEASGRRADAKSLLKTVLASTPKFDDAKNAQELVARW